MIDPSRWRKVEELFHQALEQPEPERQRWLANACEGDGGLLAEVESLLQQDKSGSSLSIRDYVAGAAQAAAKAIERDQIPRSVGSYRLLRQIGRGGMGTVYLAERADGQFDKQVAIKMVRPGMDTEFILARFRRERQVLAHFNHPNIARLLDGGTTANGIPYFVMEYIDGDWITRYCRSSGLGVRPKLRLFLRVCSAVHYAHLQFVVHRDLKPGNILIDGAGQPKLLDFGICKLLYREAEGNGHETATLGMGPLTPQYASPEQVRGEPVTIASDVYSLGAVLYELLTGMRPHNFPKLTPQVVEEVVCQRDLVAPSEVIRKHNGRLAARLRGDLDNIILHAMRKEPQRRYETVERLAEDVRRHLADEPIAARPDTFVYRSRKFLRRNRTWAIVALGLMIAFSAGLVSTELGSRLLSRTPPRPVQRLELLLELGDSYAREGKWTEALLDYQEAQKQMVDNPTAEDQALSALRDRIGAAIKLAQGHLETKTRK